MTVLYRAGDADDAPAHHRHVIYARRRDLLGEEPLERGGLVARHVDEIKARDFARARARQLRVDRTLDERQRARSGSAQARSPVQPGFGGKVRTGTDGSGR